MTEPKESIPEVIRSDLAYDGWLKVRKDQLRYASGRDGPITYIDHPGAVIIVPVDEDGLVLFVRQYRHPARRWMLELPAGTLDAGEEPGLCAEREMQEETGFRPARLERIGAFFLAPGYSSEYEHIYLASKLIESKLEGDEDEIRVERLSMDQALRRIGSGEIEDAKTSAALLVYLHVARK